MMQIRKFEDCIMHRHYNALATAHLTAVHTKQWSSWTERRSREIQILGIKRTIRVRGSEWRGLNDKTRGNEFESGKWALASRDRFLEIAEKIPVVDLLIFGKQQSVLCTCIDILSQFCIEMAAVAPTGKGIGGAGLMAYSRPLKPLKLHQLGKSNSVSVCASHLVGSNRMRWACRRAAYSQTGQLSSQIWRS